MQSPTADGLIGMVQDLTKELDNYLSRSSEPAEAVAHILNLCKQMRAMEINGTVHYWLGVIEQHARRIASPGTGPRTVGYFPASDAYWGIRLRKDIDSLRSQLMGVRSAAH